MNKGGFSCRKDFEHYYCRSGSSFSQPAAQFSVSPNQKLLYQFMCLFSCSSVRSTGYSNQQPPPSSDRHSTESLAAGESKNLPGQQNGRRRRRQWWLWDEQINELSAFMAVLFYLFGRFFQGLSNFYCTLWTVGKDKMKKGRCRTGEAKGKAIEIFTICTHVLMRIMISSQPASSASFLLSLAVGFFVQLYAQPVLAVLGCWCGVVAD